MKAHDREILVALVARLQRVLEGEAVEKISTNDSLWIQGPLELLLEKVLNVTDVEIGFGAGIDAIEAMHKPK